MEILNKLQNKFTILVEFNYLQNRNWGFIEKIMTKTINRV
jgi:hypothetical protein